MLRKSNNLTEFNFTSTGTAGDYFLPIAEGLKTNKSLKTLELQTEIEEDWYPLIGDLLMINHSLTKLSLKKTLVYIHKLPDLARGLSLNTGLKSLNISHSFQTTAKDGLKELEQALHINRTLTKLDIRNSPPRSYKDLLIHNNTLRTLKLGLSSSDDDNQWLIQALSQNKSLTKLSTFKKTIYGKDFVDKMTSVMARNDTLLYLEMCYGWEEGLLLEMQQPDEWQKKLEQNRAMARKRKSDTLLIIRIILNQRGGFTEKLPLEIWARIVSELQVPGITADLGKVFYSLLKDTKAKINL